MRLMNADASSRRMSGSLNWVREGVNGEEMAEVSRERGREGEMTKEGREMGRESSRSDRYGNSFVSWLV